MLKRILCVLLLSLSVLAVLPVVSGCEDEGDRISVEKRTTIQTKTTGGPVLTGD
jgi:hypothetical protein